MDSLEIMPLSRSAIRALLQSREAPPSSTGQERRATGRWPFPVPVELWLEDEDGQAFYQLATCNDLSEVGAGIVCDEALSVGTTFDMAIHQPEASYHGRGVVRHCTPHTEGFFVGMQFVEP